MEVFPSLEDVSLKEFDSSVIIYNFGYLNDPCYETVFASDRRV